jgi:hypothetical protein
MRLTSKSSVGMHRNLACLISNRGASNCTRWRCGCGRLWRHQQSRDARPVLHAATAASGRVSGAGGALVLHLCGLAPQLQQQAAVHIRQTDDCLQLRLGLGLYRSLGLGHPRNQPPARIQQRGEHAGISG